MSRVKKRWMYREARYIWRSFVIYKHPISYIWHRFFVGPRIRNLRQPIDRPVETEEYSLHILCSHKDLTMMLWMLASWYWALPEGKASQVYIHEDGSFTYADRKIVKHLLPHSQIVDAPFADGKVVEWLSGFPSTKKFRLNNGIPLMRKLIDPYFTGSALYRLILDTDLLWFEIPVELLDCVEKKKVCVTQSNAPMKGKVAEHLSEKMRILNSGVVGYGQKAFDIARIEEFLRLLEDNFFTHHVEQAGYAHGLSEPHFLPFDRFSLKAYEGQAMRHYTGPVREKFWFEGVKSLKAKMI